MFFDNLKDEFPTLKNNPSLVYLDSAASTQTHQRVLDAMSNYYEHKRCNVNRGDFKISQEVSQQIEDARMSVAKLIKAEPEQLMFTAGATEGLNIIAEWYKDVPYVIITEAEHTANILPWIAQGRTQENGRLIVLPVTDRGTINTEEACKLLEEHPGGLLSIHSHSNVTGIATNIKKLTKAAHDNGTKVVIDGCQTIGTHEFLKGTIDHAVFSGHKMYGPTGIGFMYSRLPLERMRAVRQGGGSVTHYDFNGNIDFYDGPAKHEVGTPNIAGILGLGVAAEWIKFTGYDNIAESLKNIEQWLSEAGLFDIPELRLVNRRGVFSDCRNVFSFTTNKLHPSDISALTGLDNVAVRVGKVCAHPIVNKVSNGKGIFRVSTHVYNSKEDCEKLVESIWKVINKLA